MVILHDLAEALTFDISKSYLTYIGKRGSVIKSEIEGSAWKHITRGIGSVSISSEYAQLQEQYVSNATIEAQIVHVADSLDILLQILELRRRGYPASLLEELWNEGVRKVKNTPVYSARQLLNSVKRKEKGLRTK